MIRTWNALAALLLMATPAQADIIFQLISANPSAPQNAASGVSVSGYARGAGLTEVAGATFNSASFSSTLDEAITNEEYIEWSFVSSTAYDLDRFAIRYDRSAQGPRNARIDFKSTVGAGGSFQTVFSDTAVSDNGANSPLINLTAFDNVTAGTFRLYAWNALSTAGTFDFENNAGIGSGPQTVSFQLEGTITAVPEPSALLLTATGLSLIGGWRRARKRISSMESVR